MDSKFGIQFLGKPLESYAAKCGRAKIVKIVGNAEEVSHLADWAGIAPILQARLITAEKRINDAKTRGLISEIPQLARETAALYASVDGIMGVRGVWYEIPPIMPDVSDWTVAWNLAAAQEFRAKGLRSVMFGFATGTPEVWPYAGQNGHGPDEWPRLYPVLEYLDSIGPEWTRIGVEEYITGGDLTLGDFSNVGRIRYVWERHIAPHGWLIMFRGIEASWDVPGTRDAGITPENMLQRGLKLADQVYNGLPYVDALALYQASDPGTYKNESKFALTPGEPETKTKPARIGYLDVLDQYWKENPHKPTPVPARPGGGTTQPPTDPNPPQDPPQNPPPQEPTPVPVALINPGFEGGTYQDGPDKFVPVGWFAWQHERTTKPQLGPIHVELEKHPPHVLEGKQAARVWTAYLRHDGGLGQRVPAVPGDLYRFSIAGYAWCPEDAHDINNPTVGTVNLQIGIDPSGAVDPLNGNVVWSAPTLGLFDVYSVFNVEAVAQGDFVTIYTRAQPSYPMERNDSFWDNAQLLQLRQPETPAVEWRPVELSGDCNLRSTPELLSDNANKIGYLGAYTEGEGGAQVGLYTRFRINGIELGWVYTKNVRYT